MFPVASLANLPPLPPLSPFSDHASSRDNPPLSALSFSLLFFLSSPPFFFFSPLPSLSFLLSFFLPLFRPQDCAEDVVRSHPSRFPASFPFFSLSSFSLSLINFGAGVELQLPSSPPSCAACCF